MLAIAKKTLDENCFKAAHKTMDRTPSTFKIGDGLLDVVLEPPVELWNIDTQFGRAGKFINHPVNLPTISLHD